MTTAAHTVAHTPARAFAPTSATTSAATSGATSAATSAIAFAAPSAATFPGATVRPFAAPVRAQGAEAPTFETSRSASAAWVPGRGSRLAALAAAVVMTWVVLAGVDGLAQHEAATETSGTHWVQGRTAYPAG